MNTGGTMTVTHKLVGKINGLCHHCFRVSKEPPDIGHHQHGQLLKALFTQNCSHEDNRK